MIDYKDSIDGTVEYRWIKGKIETNNLSNVPKHTLLVAQKYNQIKSKSYPLELAHEIIKTGEKDGEIGIQSLILALRRAEKKKNTDYVSVISSSLDKIASELGFADRFEVISLFNPPAIISDVPNPYEITGDVIFDDRLLDIYSSVLKIIQEVRPNIQVTVSRIAELVESPKKYIEDVIVAILEQRPELGEFLKLEQVFIRKENTDELVDDLISHPIPRYGTYTCYYCHTNIEDRSASICPNCNEKIVRCIVCKLPISSKEIIGSCYECQGIAHLNHLQEWLKVKGTCPVCQRKISIK